MNLTVLLTNLTNSMTGYATSINTQLKRIVTVVTNHVMDKNNPHELTAADLNLENVQNYPMATKQQALAGKSASSYLSPYTSSSALEDGLYEQLGNAFETATNQLNP